MHVYGVWAYAHMHTHIFVCTRVCVVLRQEHPITFPETRDLLAAREAVWPPNPGIFEPQVPFELGASGIRVPTDPLRAF